MGMFSILEISASGLTAERLRMDIISSNIANANSTRTETGGAYQRRVPVFATILESEMNKGSGGSTATARVPKGVKVVGVAVDNSPFKLIYDPDHPDANEEGYVEMPNVDVVKEMVDLITASRAYEANVQVINAYKSAAARALEIGR